MLIYSVFTAACGLAQTVRSSPCSASCSASAWAASGRAARRWSRSVAGAASRQGAGLHAERVGDRLRPRGARHLVVLPIWGWRAVFFVGVLPALFTIWIRRNVEEPEMWQSRRTADRGRFSLLFAPRSRARDRRSSRDERVHDVRLVGPEPVGAGLPLAADRRRAASGCRRRRCRWFVIAMQVGMWLGYVTFGFIADAFGRKRTYVTYLLTARAAPALRLPASRRWCCSLLGPFVAFFGTGYFSGFGAVTAEIYPTSIRATAPGFCYNIGRIASAVAPFVVGSLAQRAGSARRSRSRHRVHSRRVVDLDSGDEERRAQIDFRRQI